MQSNEIVVNKTINALTCSSFTAKKRVPMVSTDFTDHIILSTNIFIKANE